MRETNVRVLATLVDREWALGTLAVEFEGEGGELP